jgi:4-amino-4-deoxy-L-arabinose transferase-like glycosyltransferase/putative flippase GtrA
MEGRRHGATSSGARPGWHALIGRRHPAWRLARFAVTGGLAGLIQLALLHLGTDLGGPPLLVNAGAFLLAAQANFWLSCFTWGDRRQPRESRVALEQRWGRFHLAIAAPAALNMAVFALAQASQPTLVAGALGIAAAATVNFLLGDRFEFRLHQSRDGGLAPNVAKAPADDAANPAANRAVRLTARASAAGAAGHPRGWRAWLGEPAWSRPALLAVLGLAAILYGWDVGRNGFANEYYAAAVRSMIQSWSNFFFGAVDPGGFITVDKPPLGLWVQALSARIFGFNPWSILLPQAVAGVATVLVLHQVVRRTFGPAAALLAALVLALTPVTVAVNRDNLPDTLLVLLMVLAAWGALAAIESGRLRPLLLSALAIGLAFNTKMLQAYLIVPPLALVYLLAAPLSLRRRLSYLVGFGAVLAGISAVWLLAVELTPDDARPYIGGSQTNSALELAFGYNGLGRLRGQGPGGLPPPPGGSPPPGAAGSPPPAGGFAPPGMPGLPPPDPAGLPPPGLPGFPPPGLGAAGGPGSGGLPPPPGPGSPGFGGLAGPLRMFNSVVGGQISWLLPAALISLVAAVLVSGRAARTDGRRAAYLFWGGWLATHAIVFSFMSGIFHSYYTTAMAPAIAALVGPGLVLLWGWYRRGGPKAWLLPLMLGLSAAWPVLMLGRSTWQPWLGPAVGLCMLIAVVGLLIARLMAGSHGRRLDGGALAVGIAGLLLGPAAWAASTLQQPLMAVNPTAGPPGAVGPFDPAGSPPPPDSGELGGPGALPGVGYGGVPDPAAEPARRGPGAGAAPGLPPGWPPPGGGPPGFSGPRSRELDAQLIAYLQENRGSAKYLLATTGSMSAAPLIISTGEPVLPMGGFMGGDPAPTVAQLAAMIRHGELRFVLLGGPGGFGPGGVTDRPSWVRANCTAVRPPGDQGTSTAGLGGWTELLYDCATKG